MLWVLFGTFAALCVLRVPIAFGMFISATLSLVVGGAPLSVVPQRVWVGLNNFPLLAVPFFLFVGHGMNVTGSSVKLIDLARAIVGHLRGGLAQVNVAVCMLFAGISGVSSAETLGVGSVMIPAMKREGYPAPFAAALTASASTLGNIIPPSLMMIVYAASAGVSVGVMFLSGIVPGILIGLLQMAYSWHIATRLGIRTAPAFSLRRFWESSVSAAPALFIPVIVIGGIAGGVFTATEASAVAGVHVLLIGMTQRGFGLRKLYTLAEESVGMFSLSLLCVAAASLWGWILASNAVPQEIVSWLRGNGMLDSPAMIFTAVIIILLIVGCFMDAIPAIIILQPVIGEMADAGGIDPYHMGLVVVLTLAIGLVTPPYGLCLLIAGDLAKTPIRALIPAMMPFIWISLLVVVIAAAAPGLMLWIPRMFMSNMVAMP